MRVNQKMDRAVTEAVYWTVRGALRSTVDNAVYWAVDEAVGEAVYGAVFGAVDLAMSDDPPHPSIVDFLSAAGEEAP